MCRPDDFPPYSDRDATLLQAGVARGDGPLPVGGWRACSDCGEPATMTAEDRYLCRPCWKALKALRLPAMAERLARASDGRRTER